MAFTIVAQPDQYHPGYNPVVYGANDSTDYTLPGYRYVFSFYEDGETTPFQILKAAPNPVNGDGIVDVSKALQSFISYDLDFNTLVPFEANDSFFIYDVKIGYEYIENWTFTGFTTGGGIYVTRVKLEGTINSPYSNGDYINIRIDPDNIVTYPALNGTFKILEIGTNYVVIDLSYAALGGEPSIGGISFRNDGLMVRFYEVETISNRIVYNEAVPFKDFPGWNESFILPTNDEEPQGDILTNSPNYLQTYNDNNKYIIKPYQELYWNAMNNPAGNTGVTYANTMIVQNEFGDKWMLVDYDNYTDSSITMTQFNVSPDNQNWINITPNFGNTLGYQYGFNPYTHIGVDGTLSVSKYLDYWTTFAPGNDDCDEILLLIQLDPTVPGPPTEDYNFIARPIGRGFNGRRIYSTIIDDKYAVIWSDILSPTVRNWKITFTNGYTAQPASQYKSFATRTSNALPFGQSYANSNSADAWKAFDGNPTTFYQTTDNSGVATITYNFSTGAIRWADIQSYTINKGGATVNAPTAWRVEASQNGSTWTVVHSVTGNLTNATYNSPQLGGVVKWNYIRLVVTAAFAPIIGPTNVRIFEFSINSNATVATMTSGNDCPIDIGFTPWSWTGPNPPVGMDATILETIAVGPFTYPTLKKRRVYLDYTCQDNETQILFLDRAGSWSSFAFPLKVQERMDNEKLDYRTNIGFVEGGQWTYNTYDAEVKTYHSNVKKQYNLTTNFLNEGMDTYFQELISSPVTYVKLKDSNVWLSCNVLTKSLEPITRRLKQRTITIELNSQDNINI
jgi:hypothetical protein